MKKSHAQILKGFPGYRKFLENDSEEVDSNKNQGPKFYGKAYTVEIDDKGIPNITLSTKEREREAS